MKNVYFSLFRLIPILLMFQFVNIKANAESSLILHCPPNKYISCTDDLYHLSRFGNATYTIGYHTYSAGTPVVAYHLNSCHTGYITRTWTIEDPYWNWHTCTQTIFVSSGNQNPLDITWPLDYEVEGCNPSVKPHDLPYPYNYPTWSGDECRMIGKSYSDMVFTVNKGCKKIMRTWKLIDWCDNNGWGTQWTHNQIIKIINDEKPIVECIAEIKANSFNCKNAIVNVPSLVVGATSCGGTAIISNNSPYSTEKGANISGVYPIGTTKVTYTIQYGCGNRTYCHVNVIVKNANAPTPYCFHSITTTLMAVDTDNDGDIDNGMVDIWAKDLDRGSKSLCNYNPLRFSFSTDPTDMFKTFTCDDLGVNDVMMWVTDTKGGQSACWVKVYIQNNSANIPDCKRKEPNDTTTIQTLQYQGRISNIFNDALENAEITMLFDEPDFKYNITSDTVEVLKKDSFINASGYLLYYYTKEQQITTKTDTITQYVSLKEKSDSLGNFIFADVKKGSDAFKIKALYADEKRKGIDGKDVEFLTKYLLGEIQFTSPYQWLAADIDGNKVIDLLDLNLLINFVTNSITDLTTTPWYFMDRNVTFTQHSEIFSHNFSYIFHIDSLKNWQDTAAIIAIKVGNLTNESSLTPQEIQVENRGLEIEAIFTVYPNPSQDQLFVKVQDLGADKAVFQFSDARGALVFAKSLENDGLYNQWPVDIQRLNPGVYFYQIVSGNDVLKGKWIKL